MIGTLKLQRFPKLNFIFREDLLDNDNSDEKLVEILYFFLKI